MTEDILKLIDDIKYYLFKYNSYCTDKEMYEEFIKKAYSFLDSLNLQEWHDATKEIEGAYFNGGKNMIEKYKNILFGIKNEINDYRLRKGDEDGTIWTEKGLINYIETELQKFDL